MGRLQPPDGPDSTATARLLPLPGAAKWALAVAGLLTCWIVAGALGAQPGYDASWHLVWAGDVLDWTKPELDGWAAPTEHPLMLGVALVAAVFGEGASQMLIGLELFALLLIAPAAARLTKASMGSAAAGIAAWAILAGAYGLLLAALRGYLDVIFVLLVIWGAARGRELGGWRPMALPFALAGLLRPEAWLLSAFAAGIAIKVGDRRGAKACATAAILPPLLWFGFDAAMTGNPLLSLDTARTLALEADGGGALKVFAVSMLGGIRGPATLLGIAGLVIAVRQRGAAQLLPVALIGATGMITAAGIWIGGLTLLPRYLMLVWLALALGGGFALFGWTGLRGGSSLSRRWRNAGVALTAAGALAAVALGVVGKLSRELAIDRRMHSDLVGLLASPQVREGLGCGPLTFPSFRLVPDAILALGDRSLSVRARGRLPKPEMGVAALVTSGDDELTGRYSHPGIDLPIDEDVPPGFTGGPTSGSLTAYIRCNRLSR